MVQQRVTSSVMNGIGKKIILIVEDDSDLGIFLVEAIRQETPYLPLLATTYERAIKVVQLIQPHVLLLDYSLPRHNGIELYDHFHNIEQLAAIPAIIMSRSINKHQQEINQRHLLSLTIPINVEDFLATIEQALMSSQLS
jgi:DNA-binding NtrC family response regulator